MCANSSVSIYRERATGTGVNFPVNLRILNGHNRPIRRAAERCDIAEITRINTGVVDPVAALCRIAGVIAVKIRAIFV